MNKFFVSAFLILLSFSGIVIAQTVSNVKISGAMRNVMRLGQLYGTIDLDTIADKNNLYGIGPLEYLKGELMILEGKNYTSRIVNDSSVVVEQSWKAKAPFFVYASVEKWKETILPDSVVNLLELEKYLEFITRTPVQPFAFKLKGEVTYAKFHIVNLPEGKKVSSPEDAHKGLRNFYIENEFCDLVGFFSTSHQAVFTHHDTYIHVHIMNADKNKMGHLDEIIFKRGTLKLFLPE